MGGVRAAIYHVNTSRTTTAACKQSSTKIRRACAKTVICRDFAHRSECWYHIAELITAACLVCNLNFPGRYVMVVLVLGLIKRAALFQNLVFCPLLLRFSS
jgi:hypothetical protein